MEWTRDEDWRLKLAVDKFGMKNWQNVALHVSSRTAIQCCNRWRKGCKYRDDVVDGLWTADDERKLLIAAVLKLLIAAVIHEIPSSSIIKKSTAEINDFLADDNQHL